MNDTGVAKLLSHEIEYYSLGNLTVWINISTLSSTENTTIYMYYGNTYVKPVEPIMIVHYMETMEQTMEQHRMLMA